MFRNKFIYQIITNIFYLFYINITYAYPVDSEGNPIIDEEFTDIVNEFTDWAIKQEKDLQDIFL